jgi:hypothetical protein
LYTRRLQQTTEAAGDLMGSGFTAEYNDLTNAPITPGPPRDFFAPSSSSFPHRTRGRSKKEAVPHPGRQAGRQAGTQAGRQTVSGGSLQGKRGKRKEEERATKKEA